MHLLCCRLMWPDVHGLSDDMCVTCASLYSEQHASGASADKCTMTCVRVEHVVHSCDCETLGCCVLQEEEAREGRVAALRRKFSDSALLTEVSDDWVHHNHNFTTSWLECMK